MHGRLNVSIVQALHVVNRCSQSETNKKEK